MLKIEDLHPDAMVQFRRWLGEANAAGLADANVMVLATSSPDGVPSARVVLLKEADGRGLVFYTNYESRKGKELARNAWVAAVFYWKELRRQVRVEGRVEKVTREESARYFATRPRESQISAWASLQSRPLADPEDLVRRCEEIEEKYRHTEIPLPPHWGGYRLIPEAVEFWVGQKGRLNDRVRYAKTGRDWRIDRLHP